MSTAPRIFKPEYYERMRQLEGGSWWNAGMRDVAAMLLADEALPKHGTMLDVGCGSGQTMAWFEATHPGWQTIGFDVAQDGLEAARAFGCRVLHGSALDIPVASHSVDLAITLDVLQHLPLDGGDLRALREMRRVLKPGGVLFIRTNAQAFPATQPDRQYDFRKYRIPELRAHLEAAGFRVHRLSRVNALLGLAEIPRELRARREGAGYHGLLAQAPALEPDWSYNAKQRYLRWEGALLRRGIPMPFGRTIIAVCIA